MPRRGRKDSNESPADTWLCFLKNTNEGRVPGGAPRADGAQMPFSVFRAGPVFVPSTHF